MKRGDIVTVALQGDFGKPRPALVVQNDEVAGTRSVLLCPLTSSGPFQTLRFPISPTAANGLRVSSAVMIGNLVAASREKCGDVIGSLTPEQMAEIDIRLAFVLGLGR